MKKRILALLATAIMVVSSTVMTFADTTTGLIGQYDFEGNVKNEVTGTAATITSSKVNVDATGSEEVEYANGVNGSAVALNGLISAYGLELTDAVPSSNTFTFSYDIWYTSYSTYSPVLFLSTSWEDADAAWASFGCGWQASLAYAAGVWIHDIPGKTPQEWMDVWQSGGTTSLVDSDGNWAGWTNVTYSVDAGVVTIYVNGEDIGAYAAGYDATTAVLNIVTEASRLFVGVNAWDSPVSAAIDNLYIYDRALTADDVKELIADRDYDAATKPEIKQPETTSNKPTTANVNNADYLQPVETTTAAQTNNSNSGMILGIAVAVVVVIVVVVVVAVVAGKKKSADDDDDEE